MVVTKFDDVSSGLDSSSESSENRNNDMSSEKSKANAKNDSNIDESGLLANFNINKEIISGLKKKGIASLFPIQQKCFYPILNGNHVVARARTGSGKTLAFLLPIIQSLMSKKTNDFNSNNNYRAEKAKLSALILVPTRELATQIVSVIQESSQNKIKSISIYGGSSYEQQFRALKNGVDIVVGTPGRIKDLIDKGYLVFDTIKFAVLDEVDRMLDMGFKDIVTEILDSASQMTNDNNDNDINGKSIQFLFFSATLTPWVHSASKKYMIPSDGQDIENKREKVFIDMIGKEDLKTSKDVRHIAIKCSKASRPKTLSDLIRIYADSNHSSSSTTSKTIIFCEKKVEVDNLAISASLSRLQVQILHGDIPQAKRDNVIKSFKSGSTSVLIATDVAARGLDIPQIDLVIQLAPPQDVESYIHRSGRTGRAGRKGVAIVIYDANEARKLYRFENFAKFKFERLSAPSDEEILLSLSKTIIEKAENVDRSLLPQLHKLIESTLEEKKLGISLANSNEKNFNNKKNKNNNNNNNNNIDDNDINDDKDEKKPLKPLIDFIASLICVASGINRRQPVSLLDKSSKGVETLCLSVSRAVNSQGTFFAKLRDFIDSKQVSAIEEFAMASDRKSFIFDIAQDQVDTFLNSFINSDSQKLEICKELPKLLAKNNYQNNNNNNNSSSNYNRFGNNHNNGFRNRNRNNNNSDGRFSKQNNNYNSNNNFARKSKIMQKTRL